MFARRDRLDRADFPAVLSRGKRSVSPHFTLVASSEAHGYAVVVPKKIVRLSVDRHRAKRRVLEALRALTLPASCIVFVRTPIESMAYQDIAVELNNDLNLLSRRVL